MQANHLGVASILAALIAIIAVQGGQQPIVAISLALGAFGAAIGVLGSSAPAPAAPAPVAQQKRPAAKKQQKKAKKQQPKQQRRAEPEPEPEPVAAPSKKKKKKKSSAAAAAPAPEQPASKKNSKKSSKKEEAPAAPLSKKAKKAAAKAAAAAEAAAPAPELTKAQKRRKAKKAAQQAQEEQTGLKAQHASSTGGDDDGWEQVRTRRKPRAVTAKKEEAKSDEPTTPGESLKLEIPSKFYGTLIGSGGATLNLIQEACDVRIDIPRKNEGEIVTITGSSEGIARCKGTIESLVKTGYSSITHPGQTRNEIAVEERLRPRLVGKGACNLIALQNATNTSINLPQQGKGNKVSIVGAPDDIRRAKELIKQLLTDGYCAATHPGYVKLEMPFPTNMFGTLIGAGGGTIKHIQNSTGVMLNIPRSTDVNQNLTLIGTPESIGQAQKHINAILEKEEAEAAAARAERAEEEELWKVGSSELEELTAW